MKWAATGLATASLILLAGCKPSGTPSHSGACPTDATPIHSIQGTRFDSPLVGQHVTVAGIVTMATDDGIFIESIQPDRNPKTSEGLFLATGEPKTTWQPGTVLTAKGTVAELGERRDTQTALTGIDGLSVCGESSPRSLTNISLPLGGPDREAVESMRVSIDSASIVTDVYRLNDGDFRIAKDFYLPQPTEVARPGDEAQRRGSRNWAYSLYARLPEGHDATFAVGDELLSDEGVMGHDGIGPRLLLEESPRLMHETPKPAPPPGKGALRVLSLNLQNYFNGDGRGDDFPTPRGAETPREFAQQRERFRATLTMISPQVVAVQEIENDGFGPTSAASDFLEDLEAATGEAWAVADPGTGAIGTDQITVGLFYRSDLFRAAGPAQLLDAAPFDLLNRVPLTQVLEDIDSGERFAVNVNHFKSKGGCPDQGRDKDQRDGQGCWNAARLAAAEALVPWLNELAGEQANGRALILGDLNAYRMEDPVQKLIIEGFVDLTASIGERHQYSYVFRGQSGTLDHAFATRTLAREVLGARILNINAGQPRNKDLSPAWLRSSDHDPVIVDLRLTQSSTSD